MAERPIILNALNLAERIAKVVLTESFKDFGDHSGIKDVLLFGSVLRGEPAHDIDLLAIHNRSSLRKFGYATTYDEQESSLIPDPNFKSDHSRYDPEVLLEAVGGVGISDIFDVVTEIGQLTHDLSNHPEHGIRRNRDGNYSGTLHWPYIGTIEFDTPVSYERVLEIIDAAITERVKPKTVEAKVKALMEERGLSVNRNTFDLHLMDEGILFPERLQEERAIVISQCKDPTFWNTVLTTGRLYNNDTGKFEIPVDTKYPGASQLFPN